MHNGRIGTGTHTMTDRGIDAAIRGVDGPEDGQEAWRRMGW